MTSISRKKNDKYGGMNSSSNSLKLSPNFESKNWKSALNQFLVVLHSNIDFNLGRIIKINFINNFALTIVPLFSTMFVLYNGGIDSIVWSLINCNLIHKSC